MNPYRIVTDSNSDLVPGYAAANDLIELELTYTMDDRTYFCNDPALSRPEFYDLMRGGKMPITAQINVEGAKNEMIPALQAGEDLLCIMFSSALSGTYNSVRLAAEELSADFPERKIIVIDTLAASVGLGLLVAQGLELRAQSVPIEEAAERIRAALPHIVHLFTVDDLNHLRRGGRVSAATALVGTMLGIKPVLHVDDAGRLVPLGKVRGRRASLLALVDGMEKQIDPVNCTCFALGHGDCADDAQFVADEVCHRFKLKNYTMSYVGPTIGAHSGPGTVVICFYGRQK